MRRGSENDGNGAAAPPASGNAGGAFVTPFENAAGLVRPVPGDLVDVSRRRQDQDRPTLCAGYSLGTSLPAPRLLCPCRLLFCRRGFGAVSTGDRTGGEVLAVLSRANLPAGFQYSRKGAFRLAVGEARVVHRARADQRYSEVWKLGQSKTPSLRRLGPFRGAPLDSAGGHHGAELCQGSCLAPCPPHSRCRRS